MQQLYHWTFQPKLAFASQMWLVNHSNAVQSVINRTLLQRQEVLKTVVEPMEGEGMPVGQGTVNASVQLLLPGQGLQLPNFLLPGEAHGDRATCSERCTTLEQIETMFRASTDLKVHIFAASACHC